MIYVNEHLITVMENEETHIHTERERDRERERMMEFFEGYFSAKPFKKHCSDTAAFDPYIKAGLDKKTGGMKGYTTFVHLT